MKKTLSTLILIALIGTIYGQNKYHECLGKTIDQSEIQELFNKFELTDTTKMPTGFFYNSRNQGISFRFDLNKKLTHIFLYKQGIDGFKQYTGSMPQKLNFEMTRQEIETILGEPLRLGGGTYSNIYAIYKGGLSITFNTLNSSDYSAKIEVINIIEG